MSLSVKQDLHSAERLQTERGGECVGCFEIGQTLVFCSSSRSFLLGSPDSSSALGFLKTAFKSEERDSTIRQTLCEGIPPQQKRKAHMLQDRLYKRKKYFIVYFPHAKGNSGLHMNNVLQKGSIKHIISKSYLHTIEAIIKEQGETKGRAIRKTQTHLQ